MTETEDKCIFQVKDPIHTFTGRINVLKNLHKSIQECRKTGATISIITQVQTITGLGGIGKSETARMYIKQFNEEYDNIVWIDAEHSSEITAQFLSLADHKLSIRLRNHDNQPREFDHILQDVYEKLCRKPKLLLIIFDNAEALDNTGPITDGIRRFLPPQTSTIKPPIVLATSRQQNWEDVNVITLGLWETEECIEYIFKRLKLEDTPDNRKGAIRIAELFDRLPIAIQVGVSIIKEQSEEMGRSDYDINSLVTEYSSGNNANEGETNVISAHATIQNLLQVSTTKIKQYKQGKVALKILDFIAYLSPTKIPMVMIQWLIQDTNEQNQLHSAIRLLARYSIIQRMDNYVTIHRVFQHVIIQNLCNWQDQKQEQQSHNLPFFRGNQKTTLGDLTNSILAQISKLDSAEKYIPDIITNVVHTSNYIIQNSLIIEFYSYVEKVAELVKSTDYETAIKFYKKLINTDVSNSRLPPTITFDKILKIGSIYFSNGKYNSAFDTYTSLLHGDKSYIEDKFKTHNVLHQGQEKVLGVLHPDTLNTKYNIAVCLDHQGMVEEALKQYKDVLVEREKVLGAHHPDTLRLKHSIAGCLRNQGKSDEAWKQYKDVLELREKVLGAFHPHTLNTKHSIAVCLERQGKIEEALKQYRDVLETQEKVLGAFHPDTLSTKHSTAVCLERQGKIEEALKQYNEVLELREKVLGARHPYTLNTKHNIALCLFNQGKIEEALKQCKDVLESQEKVLGALHPYTLSTTHNFAACLFNQGKIEEALKHYKDVFEAQEKILGALHPATLLTKNNIAICQKKKPIK